jgi:Mg2+ and Co2+ transporter CorA
MDDVLDSEQEEQLNRLFHNARFYQTSFENNQYTVPIHTDIKSTQAAINALRSPPPLVGGMQADINLISVPTPKNTFFAVQQTFLTTFNFALPFHIPPTDGEISFYGERTIFETPTCGESYVFLFMTKLDKSWQGCIIHDMGNYTLETAVPSTQYIQDTRGRPFQPKCKDDSDWFVDLLVSNLVLQYLNGLRSAVRQIEERIENVNTAVHNNVTHVLSDSMLELNKCSGAIRNTRLEQQTAFAFEAGDWMCDGPEVRNYDHEVLRLYRMIPKPRNLYSGPLKESIAEVRAGIADVAAQQYQEREEQRWAREEQRWKDREEAEQRRDAHKFERERKRQDAKDSYERDKELRRTERESKRIKDEEEQRADQLQRQNVRQALEDQRAEDAKKLQDLSVKIAGESIKIAEESLRDSRTMRGIAWLTMAFLPATFVSSFFGMSFFNGVPGTPEYDEGSRGVWIFFVVAVPISAFVLVGFGYWDRRTQAMAREQRIMREKVV